MFATETLSRVERRASRTRLPRLSLVGKAGAPIVVVLGGISASRHITSSASERGWWDAIVGDDRAIDTSNYRVLGLDFLDAGRGATGRPCRVITTHDQANALAAALDSLGESRVHAVVGSSYGGMVALAFAECYGAAVERLVVFSAAHESHPMSTALRTLQRRIVELGIDSGRVDEAMSIARGLAMTTYRSATEFAARFDTAPLERTLNDARFEVDAYLRNRADGFVAAMPPERFLALSLSADLHRVNPRSITVPCTLVAAQDDSIAPRWQMQDLAARMSGPAKLLDLPTTVGHDAFLVETSRVSSILTAALA